MAEWDEDGNEKGFTLPQGERKIVVVTHDESTFYAYDSRRSIWVEKGEMPLRPKGKGRGIMVFPISSTKEVDWQHHDR